VTLLRQRRRAVAQQLRAAASRQLQQHMTAADAAKHAAARPPAEAAPEPDRSATSLKQTPAARMWVLAASCALPPVWLLRGRCAACGTSSVQPPCATGCPAMCVRDWHEHDTGLVLQHWIGEQTLLPDFYCTACFRHSWFELRYSDSMGSTTIRWSRQRQCVRVSRGCSRGM
jgi:hypothetical protein